MERAKILFFFYFLTSLSRSEYWVNEYNVPDSSKPFEAVGFFICFYLEKGNFLFTNSYIDIQYLVSTSREFLIKIFLHISRNFLVKVVVSKGVRGHILYMLYQRSLTYWP